MLSITNYCQPSDIYLESKDLPDSKQGYQCISYFIQKIQSHYTKEEIMDIKKNLLEREKICSTTIGNFIAVPHCRTKVTKPSLRIFRFSKAIDFKCSNKNLVKLFFLLILPLHAKNEHLIILSKIAKMGKNKEWLKHLLDTPTREDFYEYLKKIDFTLSKK